MYYGRCTTSTTKLRICERFLAPSFKGERTSVMFWGAVGYNSHSPLVAVRRRDPSERTSDKDIHTCFHYSQQTQRLFIISVATWDLQNSLASQLETLLKQKLWRQWCNPDKRPHNREELINAAQPAWEELPWTRIYR